MAVLAYVGRDNGGNTQVVYSIYFMTDVENGTIISVALRVLSMEKKDDIQIGGQQYPLAGKTGIFNALNETQTDSDGEWTPALVRHHLTATIWENSDALLDNLGEQQCTLLDILGESNAGDIGRAAILEILGEQQ